MINYQLILNKNLLNVFIEILKKVEINGFDGNNHLYVTFETKNPKTSIPEWLLQKYPEEMTIVIQHEYYYLKVNKNNFDIGLSFNNKKSDLKISYESVISFADPSANFGINYKFNNIKKNKNNENNIKKKIDKNNSNVIKFTKFKKN
tara:strand:- start:1270 stop:1710 length:441 start_codon:yes stop_codon:yes gene_type:complete